MNLAILGSDEDILRLARAAVSQGHAIVWLGDIRPDEAAEFRALAPHLSDRATDWELLLDRAIADAVLIGRGTSGSDVRADQLKRLATEAVPMLVNHPITGSVLAYYELDMIRRETSCPLRHFNPLVGHPVLADLAAWLRDGHPAAGKIHQLTCERRVDNAARDMVLGHLARDCELIAAIAGDIRRVTAIGPHADDVSFASLQVQMKSDQTSSLRWSVGSGFADRTALEVVLLAERGTVKLRVLDAGAGETSVWKLETIAGTMANEETVPPFDAAQNSIEQLATAVTQTNVEGRAAASTWDAATRAMEVVDAVTLSLEKGRTIEVFQQQLTERLAFRGAMAAMGCGLLLVGFFVVVAITLLGGAEGAAGQRLIPSWPGVLLAVLAFFLLLQAVPMLASVSKKRRQQ